MSNNKNYLIIIFFLSLTFILGIGIYFISGNEPTLLSMFYKLQNKNQVEEVDENENLSRPETVKLPILPGEKDVLSSLILYFFQAPVKVFVIEGDGYHLELDTENKKIPTFHGIINRTQISRLNTENPSERPLPATVDEIKEGAVIQVGANYDFIGKVWTVGGITIISSE